MPWASSLALSGASPSGKRARLTAQSPVFSYQPVSSTNVSIPIRAATSISASIRVAFIDSRYGLPFQCLLRSWKFQVL